MSASTTCAPCCAKRRAICSPMPDPAPVTKAIFLSRRNTAVSFLTSVGMEYFLHGGPPLARRSRLQWHLHRLGPGPPLARLRVCRHLRHICLEIVANVFKIREKLFTMTKNTVVAHIAGRDHRQHFGPDGGVQAFVCFDLVGFQANELSKPAQRLPPFIRPLRPLWIGIGSHRRGIHRYTVARSVRGYIAAIFDDGRMHKMFVQMGSVLDHTVLQRAANSDVVEDRKVLHVFT